MCESYLAQKNFKIFVNASSIMIYFIRFLGLSFFTFTWPCSPKNLDFGKLEIILQQYFDESWFLLGIFNLNIALTWMTSQMCRF